MFERRSELEKLVAVAETGKIGGALAGRSGCIRATADGLWTQVVLPEAVGRFREAFPGIELRLRSAGRAEGLRLLDAGDSDLHCGGIDGRERLPGHLRREPLPAVTLGVVAHRNHPLQAGAVTVAALADWPWIDCIADARPQHGRRRAHMAGEVDVEPGDGRFEFGPGLRLEGELRLYRARHAGREQRLLVGNGQGPEFDVWIAFVASVPRTVQSEVLFEEALVPVCSPGLLASRGRPEHPDDLHGWPLLYDLAWDDYWAHWFASRGAGAPDMSRASGYRLYSMMVQAAVEGMGVTLGHSQLIAPHLERGTLVSLFEPPVAAPARYFLAVAAGSGEKPQARAFLDWLRAETAKSDAGGQRAAAPLRKAKAESGAAGRGDGRLRWGHFGTLSLPLEGALNASLRNGNGGAMLVMRVPEMGCLERAISGAIRPKIFGLGSENQPSGISYPTANNSASEFSRFTGAPATERAPRAAVPAAPGQVPVGCVRNRLNGPEKGRTSAQRTGVTR